jgi:hypothetical protein
MNKPFELFCSNASLPTPITFVEDGLLSAVVEIDSSLNTIYQPNSLTFMSYQNISYDLLAADLDEVKAAIATINAKLPFLVTLDSKEIIGLTKLGPKSADFVADAGAAATNFPQILPPSFDVAEYAKDTALFKSLSEIKINLDSLVEKVDHTYTAVGSEAMQASLEVYAYVQTARDRTPGLQSVADKLKDRFKKAPRAKKQELK